MERDNLLEKEVVILKAIADLSNDEREHVIKMMEGDQSVVPTDWEKEIAYRQLFAIFKILKPIGIASWTGRTRATQMTIWIRSDCRKSGFGTAAIHRVPSINSIVRFSNCSASRTL